MSNLILYPKEEASFNNNGIGILRDVIEAKVMERLNGEFELTFKYPARGSFFSDIQEDCYVSAPPSPGRAPQPFRIYKTTKIMAGYITVLARHRAYNLRRICVSPFEAGSAALAMQQLKTNAVTACPFEFWTDKETVASMKVMVPSSAWDLLGGTRGSILDTFGGEYEFDGDLVRLRSHRGSDQGVTIRYGKNLVDLQQERNIAEMITGVYPFWADNDGNELVQLPEKILKGPGTYTEDRDIPLDLSQEFEEKPTEEELRSRAQKYIDGRNIGKPEVSLKIQFAQLEKTEEYKDMAFLERVELGDTVAVAFPPMGVDVTARVVSTEYDPLLDHYISVTLGRVKASLASAMAHQEQEMQKIPGEISEAQTELQKAIKAATSWLTNGLGYKVERRDGNGNTVDTLYMDTPDINQAKDVLRIGQSGIGFSHTGVSGPYVSAWTIDGHFNADFIVTGILNANLLRAGVIMDKTGKNYWDLDSGEAVLNFSNLTINGVTPQSMADGAKDAAIQQAETIAKEKADAAGQAAKDAAEKALSAYKDLVSGSLTDIQGQIDGSITTFFQPDLPTAENYPASEWKTEEDKNRHLGDLYYIDGSADRDGEVYRWKLTDGVYSWGLVEDTAVTKAVAQAADAQKAASDAQKTADGKMRVFGAQPVPPYDVNDLWSKGDQGGMMICTNSRAAGEFVASDWQSAADYINQAQSKAIADESAKAAASDAQKAAAEALDAYKLIVDQQFSDIGSTVDGLAVTWFRDYDAAADKDPSNAWTDEQKAAHADDLFYNTKNANLFRWTGSAWEPLKDPDIKAAFEKAASAETAAGKAETAAGEAKTAAGSKRRVFGVQPYPPYDKNDLWVAGPTGGIKRCKTARASGKYVASDWENASNYVDSATAGTIAQDKVNAQTQQSIFNKLTNNGQVQGIYIKDGKVYLNASYIATGTLADTARNMVIDLSTGKVTMKKGSINLGNGNFVVDEFGEITAKRGTIGNMTIANDSFSNGVVSIQDGICIRDNYPAHNNIAIFENTVRTNQMSAPKTILNLNIPIPGRGFCITEPDYSSSQGLDKLIMAFSVDGGFGNQVGNDIFELFRSMNINGNKLLGARIDLNSCSFSPRGVTDTIYVGGYNIEITEGVITGVY